MKGILGERKAYGQRSPLDALFTSAGVPYRGTRTTNGYQKAPWYLYESYPGDGGLIDLASFEAKLVKKGYYRRVDDEVDEVDRPGGCKVTVRWYYKDNCINQTGESLMFANYVYPKKPERNYAHIGHKYFL